MVFMSIQSPFPSTRLFANQIESQVPIVDPEQPHSDLDLNGSAYVQAVSMKDMGQTWQSQLKKRYLAHQINTALHQTHKPQRKISAKRSQATGNDSCRHSMSLVDAKDILVINQVLST